MPKKYKIRPLILLLLAGALILAACEPPVKPAADPTSFPSASLSPTLTFEALSNLEYMSDFAASGRAKLVDGQYREPSAPDSATELTIQLVEPSASGDLDGDNRPDAVVLLVPDPGGSGTFYTLAAVLDKAGKPHHGASVLLGDRVQVKEIRIDSGTVVVRMVAQGPNDPMCCPSLEVTKRYRLEDGQLVAVGN